jgi:DNA gyrase subunit B
MNPEQLWETTLDPDARTLLQVRVNDVAEAEDIFLAPHGRCRGAAREFIQPERASGGHLDT